MLFYSSICYSQKTKTENVVVVTLDGMRWQEIFGGADSALLKNKEYTRDPENVSNRFWDTNIAERRKKLFPFLWSTVATEGQLYGNRWKNSNVNNANPYWFSYPGYNEIFTGFPDTAVNSNDKIPNKNENVLGFINKQKGYAGKVAAFTTWDCFPYILNEAVSGVYVNADVDTLHFANNNLNLINEWQFLTTRPIGVRPDVITYMAAREYLKAYMPKVLYIAFDETDDFAHGGMYDQYLGSAYAEDRMIADLWQTLQSLPQYKNKTTLLITCDHGRGDKIKDQWKDHGQKVEDAGHIWIAAIGPDSKHLGEIENGTQLYQKQIAATIAKLLGFTFTAPHPVADPIQSIIE
jgi:hypothetical protein